MPTTEQASQLLREIRNLMRLAEENPFKVRAFERAESIIADCEDLDERIENDTLTELPGIGKGISEVLKEYYEDGTSSLRDELKDGLPDGLVELVRVPGLGPKKARKLIDELEIKSVSELEYACQENRLVHLKGFGIKLQDRLLMELKNQKLFAGKARLADVFPIAEALFEELRNTLPEGTRIEESGTLRRRLEVIEEIDVIIETQDGTLKGIEDKVQEAIDVIQARFSTRLPVKVHAAKKNEFGSQQVQITSSQAHWDKLESPSTKHETEESLYKSLDLPTIPPEMRETGEEVELARKGKLDKVLSWNGIQGVFHNHTVYSDGAATVEQMVVAAKKLGYSYIGISEHSQSSVYARGLRKTEIKKQKKEIQAVQEKHPDIRIFFGIESDILGDGSLDYDKATLKEFDFVIASIHSRFQMDEKAMTNRILKAIKDPNTTMLGHPTGRLLLGRKGYDLDFEKVIETCSKANVAIEINSNPHRLDLDWRYGGLLRKHKTMVCVNPDAHNQKGLAHTKYGIAVARKAMLPTDQVLNSRTADEVADWFKKK